MASLSSDRRQAVLPYTVQVDINGIGWSNRNPVGSVHEGLDIIKTFEDARDEVRRHELLCDITGQPQPEPLPYVQVRIVRTGTEEVMVEPRWLK